MKGLEKSALSVSAVAFFLSDLIKDQLGPVLIRGEISNLQLRPNSSYIRFSLKDSSAKIDCLTHQSSNASKLLSHLQDGDEVLVFAQPSYYTKYGQISFFTDEMMKLGKGIFHSNLEKLRQQLYEEGFFNKENKKSIPKYPTNIGVITSADGAALQDILRIIQDRFPLIHISVFPSLVQGKDAPPSLYNALQLALSKKEDLDVIIIGRGGGSTEDLEAFNDENLVRLIASADTPIISAVGHEVDSSLTDFVADISAPTPTGAAMIVCPDKVDILSELSQIKQQLHTELSYLIKEEFIELDCIKQDFIHYYQQYLNKQKQELELLALKIHENNPDNILEKGFSAILSTESEQKIGKEILIKTNNKLIYATINRIQSIEE